MKRSLDDAVAALPRPRGPQLHPLMILASREDLDDIVRAYSRERDDDGCPGGRHDGSLCRGRALARVARAYLAAIDSTDGSDG